MKRRISFAKSHCLVTGATKGLGRAMAGELARQGARLILTGRSLPRLEATIHELVKEGVDPEILTAIDADLTEPEGRSKLIHVIDRRFGTLDLLINAAQVRSKTPSDPTSPDLLRPTFEINQFTLIELTTILKPLLLASNNPIVINLGPVSLPETSDETPESQASQSAIATLTQALGEDWWKLGIHLITVAKDPSIEPDFWARMTLAAIDCKSQQRKSHFKLGLQDLIQKTVERFPVPRMTINNIRFKPNDRLPRPHFGLRMDQLAKKGD